MSQKPVAIDLFCGLFGWSEGLTQEGWRTIGFDLEDMRGQFGFERLPDTQLVIQDVTTLHGSQFRNADLIVASPPCQEYSYMAMPWSLAKAKAATIRADESGEMLADLTRLFDACFRIQREACEASDRYIPLIVENVRGAIPWVGRSRWNFGSYHLWGDVPALMPFANLAFKVPSFRFDGNGSFQSASVRRTNVGLDYEQTGRAVLKRDGEEHLKMMPMPQEGRKGVGSGSAWFYGNQGQYSSKSSERKMASAMIAKIPLSLSLYIARTFKPMKYSEVAE
jgi:hypothetical protein